MKEKKSFFERLANTIVVSEDDNSETDIDLLPKSKSKKSIQYDEEDYEDLDFEEESKTKKQIRPDRSFTKQASYSPVEYQEEMEEEGELSVDVYQTPKEIIIEAMVAGVKPEDLHLTITRDMVIIKGRREANTQIQSDDYFYKELYWGNFSRTILLPHEVDMDQAEAVEKHGLLLLRIPKIDKEKHNKVKVKSI